MKLTRTLAALLLAVAGLAACTQSSPTDPTAAPVALPTTTTATPSPTETATPSVHAVPASHVRWRTHCAFAFCAQFPFYASTGDAYVFEITGKKQDRVGHFVSTIFRVGSLICASDDYNCAGVATNETYSVVVYPESNFDQWTVLRTIKGTKLVPHGLDFIAGFGQSYRMARLTLTSDGSSALAVYCQHRIYLFESHDTDPKLHALVTKQFLASVRFGKWNEPGR